LLLSTQIITADIKRLGQKMKNPTSKIHNENQSSPKSQCEKKLFVWMVADLGKSNSWLPSSGEPLRWISAVKA